MKLAGALAAFLLPLTSTVLAADVDAWKSRNIYFALTDRIARGSDDTGGSACGDLSDYCGGTFQGLQSKLDYIQGMGFDAIWITPVVASQSKIPLDNTS
jgi:alpha-amylase